MDVSVIIVNWNSIDYLNECVNSICDQTRGLALEIIVVDNASPAGDAEMLEQRFPQVLAIKSPVNLGFAGANNLGFKRSAGKYVLFLNPDTRLVGPAINVMVQGIQSLPDAGVVGCKLLNTDLSIQTSCIQTFPTILNQLLDSDWIRGRWPTCKLWAIGPLFSISSEPSSVEVISGACMLIDRHVFERVGYFSEDYFMYAEDLDLCYKTVRAGYSNYYLSAATVIHHGGKSTNPEYATRMKWKSIPRFYEKYYGLFYASMFRLTMIFAAVARLAVIAMINRFGTASLRSNVRQESFAKWKLILKTLATSSVSPSPAPRRTLPDCNMLGL
jgi:N-acetylglucosaminyl-diphospho-decaprenol L-rhamnosyltransferase